MTKNKKNKIYTPGYFIKRLRNSGFIVIRQFQEFAKHDSRRWVVLVDPGNTSVFVTCFQNKSHADEIMFSLDDGGGRFARNTYIKTDSIEVIVTALIDAGVSQASEDSRYIASKALNNADGTTT